MSEFKITAQDFMDIFIVQTLSTIRTKEDAKENCYFDTDENEWRIRSESSIWGSFYYARHLGSRVLREVEAGITLSFKLNHRMKKFVNAHVKNIMDSVIENSKLEAKQ